MSDVRTGVIKSSSGATNMARGGLDGTLMADTTHGRYQEAVLNGNVYSASNQTGCIWTVELATTYTGLCLSNTLGSGKALSILAAGWSERVAPGGIQDVWLAGGSSATAVTHSAAGAARNMLVGSSNASVAKVDTGATLPAAPVYLMPLVAGKVTAALSLTSYVATIDVGGLICLLPGSFLIIATFTVGNTAGQMATIIYEELPYEAY
jgi:hypothetical protein